MKLRLVWHVARIGGGGVGRKRPGVNGSRSDVRSTRGPGPTMTARGQSIGIGGDYGTKDIQVLHYGISP